MNHRIGGIIVFGLLAQCVTLSGIMTRAQRCDAADDPVRQGQGDVADARRLEARRVATEKRRAWLRNQLSAELRDEVQLRRLNARLDALNDQQVDLAAAKMLERLDQRGDSRSSRRAMEELARAKAARDALRRAAAARHAAAAATGFAPFITVLPQGAGLTASAVVSPDGRHVRINAIPFFSSIGPVDTFNFFTGETRRPPAFNPQLREPPPVAQGTTVSVHELTDSLVAKFGPSRKAPSLSASSVSLETISEFCRISRFGASHGSARKTVASAKTANWANLNS